MELKERIWKALSSKLSPEAAKQRDEACQEIGNTLSPIAAFVGDFTLSTYFSIRCLESITAAFLRSIFILFLRHPLIVLTNPVAVHSLPEGGPMLTAILLLHVYLTVLKLASGLIFVSFAFHYYTPLSLIEIGGGGLFLLVLPVCYVWRIPSRLHRHGDVSRVSAISHHSKQQRVMPQKTTAR